MAATGCHREPLRLVAPTARRRACAHSPPFWLTIVSSPSIDQVGYPGHFFFAIFGIWRYGFQAK